ncbi:alpha/beta hydrolase-fold protein [Paenibacillus polysaccharolyticus]|uniref:alpha/beta hydrolase n=1 Tax=Paenibacillus polysaccharolyticus TaxID=582692 RepID=UPI002041F382|nr:alpha/beta hydrolase-fold protein [Paenibacillus polysaccharolyticus]MCM3135494.1 alpha/beta hydrolase-fold protein [Paenibacillus polysaccharolyticus]
MNSTYMHEVKLPPHYDKTQQYPVIFALHGMGSDEQDMLRLMEPLSTDFIIVAIRGPIVQGGGYAYFQIKSIGNPVRELYDASVQGLQQLIIELSAQYAIDPARRYIAGFSQGGIMAMTLALVMGDAIKGIVAMSGYIPQFVKEEYALKPYSNLSAFISHGDQDHLFPLQLGEDNASFFRNHTNQVTYVPYSGGHHVTPELYAKLQHFLRTDAGVSTEDKKGMTES